MNRSFPIDAKIINPETQLEETVQLTKESIARTIRSLLSIPTYTQQIPFIVSEAYKGNYAVLAELILRINMSSSKGIFTAMRLCVICYEDYPKIPETTEDALDQTFLKDIWTNRIINACKIWNPTRENASRVHYTNHDIPVLLISGERDSATPPKYGDQVVKYFKNSRHIVVTNSGHSFDRMLNCVEYMINDFVISGTAQDLELDCLKSIEYPEFKLN